MRNEKNTQQGQQDRSFESEDRSSSSSSSDRGMGYEDDTGERSDRGGMNK